MYYHPSDHLLRNPLLSHTIVQTPTITAEQTNRIPTITMQTRAFCNSIWLWKVWICEMENVVFHDTFAFKVIYQKGDWWSVGWSLLVMEYGICMAEHQRSSLLIYDFLCGEQLCHLCHLCHCYSQKYIVIWFLVPLGHGICMGEYQTSSLWFIIFFAGNNFVTFVTIPRFKCYFIFNPPWIINGS